MCFPGFVIPDAWRIAWLRSHVARMNLLKEKQRLAWEERERRVDEHVTLGMLKRKILKMAGL